MWTTKTRVRYHHDKLCYPSDFTEEEWAYSELLIPPVRQGGCKRSVDVREILNDLLYVLRTQGRDTAASSTAPLSHLDRSYPFGIQTRKVEPWPTVLSTATVPPKMLSNRRTMDNPNPVPPGWVLCGCST